MHLCDLSPSGACLQRLCVVSLQVVLRIFRRKASFSKRADGEVALGDGVTMHRMEDLPAPTAVVNARDAQRSVVRLNQGSRPPGRLHGLTERIFRSSGAFAVSPWPGTGGELLGPDSLPGVAPGPWR